jgi:hypothetical protein
VDAERDIDPDVELEYDTDTVPVAEADTEAVWVTVDDGVPVGEYDQLLEIESDPDVDDERVVDGVAMEPDAVTVRDAVTDPEPETVFADAVSDSESDRDPDAEGVAVAKDAEMDGEGVRHDKDSECVVELDAEAELVGERVSYERDAVSVTDTVPVRVIVAVPDDDGVVDGVLTEPVCERVKV